MLPWHLDCNVKAAEDVKEKRIYRNSSGRTLIFLLHIFTTKKQNKTEQDKTEQKKYLDFTCHFDTLDTFEITM